MTEEGVRERELARAQVHDRLPHHRLPRAKVERRVVDRADGRLGDAMRAGPYADAREQLLEAERLRDGVVAGAVETGDGVGDGAAGRQDDDGQRPTLVAKLAED